MIDVALLKKFLDQFSSLKTVVSESSARSMREVPDNLFSDNQNVFIKLYLVSACSMLEAFLQDLALAYVEALQLRVYSANLPFNFVVWATDHEKAKLHFSRFVATKNRRDISDLLSPNYWKTIQAFERIGIDLSLSPARVYKDFVVSTVEKRNKIVHDNDDALDLSFSDIIKTIDQFSAYAECLFETVCVDPHLANEV